MKVPVTAAVCAAATLLALPVSAQDAVAAACTGPNLVTGVKMAESPFYREFHNQDLVKAINELRRSAEADMARGDMLACGQKATAIQAMLGSPSTARVTLAEYQSRVAAQTGQSVQSTLTVGEGRHITQQELMGMPLKSLSGDTLGTITGVIYSASGQPLYISATPSQAVQATTPVSSLTVPVSMLLTKSSARVMYVALSTQEFWKEPRFRDTAAAIQPAE